MSVYGASVINRRQRSTKAEMTGFRQAVWDLAERYGPLTGRQLYYRAVVAGLVDKDEGSSRANETRVAKAIGWMRERYVDYRYGLSSELDGLPADLEPAEAREHLIMPFSWVADNTRTRYQAAQYSSKDQALRTLHNAYRRNLWHRQPYHVEVWCESDALADVIHEVTNNYGLALLPCRGQAGKRFVYDSAQAYASIGKPIVVLYIGDFDPCGLDIRKSLHERMIRYGAPDVDFRWLAITPYQVLQHRLPGHGLNRNIQAPVLERFYGECDQLGIPHEAVEAEAMEPAALRSILQGEIGSLIDQRLWNLEKVVEREEKRDLRAMLSALNGDTR